MGGTLLGDKHWTLMMSISDPRNNTEYSMVQPLLTKRKGLLQIIRKERITQSSKIAEEIPTDTSTLNYVLEFHEARTTDLPEEFTSILIETFTTVQLNEQFMIKLQQNTQQHEQQLVQIGLLVRNRLEKQQQHAIQMQLQFQTKLQQYTTESHGFKFKYDDSVCIRPYTGLHRDDVSLSICKTYGSSQ